MSDYATFKDVQKKFMKVEFSDKTKPTLKAVKAFITEKSNYIDSRISSRYVLPVDEDLNEQGFSVVRQICVWLVVAEIEDILNLGRTVPKADSDKVVKTRGRKMFDNAMDEINRLETGETTLIGVPIAGGENRFFNSNNQSPCFQPVFKKNERQW